MCRRRPLSCRSYRPIDLSGNNKLAAPGCTGYDLSTNRSPFASFVQALRTYFDNTWALTESLFAGLQGEEAFMCPPAHGLRHPMIFYYGHAAVFYVNKLRAAGLVQVRGVEEYGWSGERESMLATILSVVGLLWGRIARARVVIEVGTWSEGRFQGWFVELRSCNYSHKLKAGG